MGSSACGFATSECDLNLRMTMNLDKAHLLPRCCLCLRPAAGPRRYGMRLHLSLTGPSQRTFIEPCSPLSSHREME